MHLQANYLRPTRITLSCATLKTFPQRDLLRARSQTENGFVMVELSSSMVLGLFLISFGSFKAVNAMLLLQTTNCNAHGIHSLWYIPMSLSLLVVLL